MESCSSMQVIGDWLFKGSDVYLLSDPGTRLKVKRINWDAETSDLIDAQGRLYKDVSWDSMEFWSPQDYHLADQA
jgi:hypothetical protein